MKDRVKMVMESQHMNQQAFAQFLEISTSQVSTVLNGKSKPSMNIVEAIKAKIPNINIQWLIFGDGEMFVPSADGTQSNSLETLNQGTPSFNTSSHPASVNEPDLFGSSPMPFQSPSRPVPRPSQPPQKENVVEVKMVERKPSKITEIRIYFDDKHYETFVPETSAK